MQLTTAYMLGINGIFLETFSLKRSSILKIYSCSISLPMYEKEHIPNYVTRKLIEEKHQILKNGGWHLPCKDNFKSDVLLSAYAMIDASERVLLNSILHESALIELDFVSKQLKIVNAAHRLSELRANRNSSNFRCSTIKEQQIKEYHRNMQ